jgi:uncharacterized protein DUF5996
MSQPQLQEPPASIDASAWPELRLADWSDTKETLHLWTQIVGKVRLALARPINHWWHCALYVNARGLTTSAMPANGGSVEIRFDFIDHQLLIERSDGRTEAIALEARSVADFYHATMNALNRVGTPVRIHATPVEMEHVIPFAVDETHGTYDRDAATRCWRALTAAHDALAEFRGKFIGKCSPVHFWWGAFDIACTRFSGRRAPTYSGAGAPNCPSYVMLEAYSHECISAGWWPGGGLVDDAAFYAYAYPEPNGCAMAPIRPAMARYDTAMHEWLLPYEAARASGDPRLAVAQFLASTYDVAANLGAWDRGALER